MPIRLSTTLTKIQSAANTVNGSLLLELYENMKIDEIKLEEDKKFSSLNEKHCLHLLASAAGFVILPFSSKYILCLSGERILTFRQSSQYEISIYM